jgi:hypothetical protein
MLLIITAPLLVLLALVCLLGAIRAASRGQRPRAIQCVLVPMAVLASIVLWSPRRPMPLTEADVIGRYCVDPSIYAGAQAEWQRQHFWFDVGPGGKFILHELLDDGSRRQIPGKLTWHRGPPDLWTVAPTEPHHVLAQAPLLFRSDKRFFYVMRSPQFGNMFFRRAPAAAGAIGSC